jgi:hypothetical protein
MSLNAYRAMIHMIGFSNSQWLVGWISAFELCKIPVGVYHETLCQLSASQTQKSWKKKSIKMRKECCQAMILSNPQQHACQFQSMDLQTLITDLTGRTRRLQGWSDPVNCSKGFGNWNSFLLRHSVTYLNSPERILFDTVSSLSRYASWFSKRCSTLNRPKT